ncbi:MAG: dipeptidase, partial [Solobacterium sp.]|nr:dipeptidase [Solobacterium sp.]
TGDTEAEPLVIGGGTYAKTVGNTIAFGCAFPGYDYHLHDADENCPVEHLLKQVEIYVQAILNLNEAE